jgi:catechol 2,3-dioxygenase-like lactoylglutathione lyase family enzyme
MPQPPNAILCLRLPDVEAGRRFYREVLDLTELPASFPHFDLGGVFLVLRQGAAPPPPDEPDPFPQLAFIVPDLAVNLERLQEHKVDLPWGVEDNGRDRWVRFYDPAGNLLELAQFNALVSR